MITDVIKYRSCRLREQTIACEKQKNKWKKFLTNGFEHDKLSKLSDENSKEPWQLNSETHIILSEQNKMSSRKFFK